MDAFDTLNHTRKWHVSEKHPVTSLPLLQQLPFSFSLSMTTYLGIVTPSTIYAVLFVGLGFSPEAWPPIFDRPFSAVSLQDFWTHKWHHIFRRVFDRIALPIMLIIPKSVPLSVRRFVRAILIFGLSAGFHLVLIERMLAAPRSRPSLLKDAEPGEPAGPGWAFFDPSTLKFFLLQPVGLFIERALLVPLISPLPSGVRVFLNRLWAWGWLMWTGRYWADAWVRGGMWGEDEGYVGWSPIRGIAFGQWWTV